MSFYGAKWRAATRYPPPIHRAIVEPFAGSAGYSLRYPHLEVTLVERDPLIAATWRYLLSATAPEILALPDVPDGVRVDTLDIPAAAQLLIGWWLGSGCSSPRQTPSAWMRRYRGGTKSFWSARIRARIASQLDAIRHWHLVEGDWSEAPDLEATWFVDPPYQIAGRHYRCSQIDYANLAYHCATGWRGQVIVCENVGADWLPFRPFIHIKSNQANSARTTSQEAIWTRASSCGSSLPFQHRL